MANDHVLTDFDLAMLVGMSERNFENQRAEYEEVRSWFSDISDLEIEKVILVVKSPPEDFEEFRRVGRDNIVPMFLSMLRVSIEASEEAIENLRHGRLLGKSLYDLLFLMKQSERLKIILREKSGRRVDQGAANRAVQEILSERGRRGGEARDEKFDPIRQFALKLANDGAYPSRRQAVLAIKTQVVDHAISMGVKMSHQQSQTTIEGWLKDLGYTPSASKRGTSTS
ncbi:hypothetical protein [Burkholderia gladioli]|uniref:hypothetical protein n=1 Tax=Burkholderia gladioli TaxID=28095 RepID=UPI001641CD62|nr:hypothetical protein [Burkholderia gladioli]